MAIKIEILSTKIRITYSEKDAPYMLEAIHFCQVTTGMTLANSITVLSPYDGIVESNIPLVSISDEETRLTYVYARETPNHIRKWHLAKSLPSEPSVSTEWTR